MAENLSFQILALGLDKRIEEFIESCFSSGGTLVKISQATQFEEQYEHWQDGEFAGIFCSSNIPELSGNELGQALQNQCPKTHKYFITYDLATYEPSVLLKNGFTNVFCLPQDRKFLIRTIKEEILTNVSDQKSLRPIKIFDVGPEEKLDFGTYVFLPLNNRFIPFSNSNQPIESSRLDKLTKHEIGRLYIDKNDMNKFYVYSANRLRAIAQPGISATERQSKLESHVRGLFNSIFDQAIKTDFAGGKEMLENCQNIISNFITSGSSNDWYARLLASIGELNDPYNHASRVSTFAALFAIGMNHPRPEDLAMAGMFHDLGMIELPESVIDHAESEWTPEERALYQSHPEKTLFYLKQKRISLPADVEKAILQHHEKSNATGFPKGFNSERITTDAQILSYADQFDYFTRLEPGKKSLTPLEAHAIILKTESIDSEIAEKIGRLIDLKGI